MIEVLSLIPSSMPQGVEHLKKPLDKRNGLSDSIFDAARR